MMQRRRWSDGDKTLGTVVAWVLLISALIVWGRVGWVLFYPYDPLEVKPLKILNVGERVQRGDNVFYLFDADKKMPLPCVVTRQLVNHIILTETSFPSNIAMGKTKTSVPFHVPSFVDTGIYHLRNTYAYTVSEFPKRVITVVVESGPFEVTE